MDFKTTDIQIQQRSSSTSSTSEYINIAANSSALNIVTNLLAGLEDGKIVKYDGKTLVNSLINESGSTVSVGGNLILKNVSGDTVSLSVDSFGNLIIDGNIISTGSITAYGIGTGNTESSGGTGGGLISIVYGTEDLTNTFSNSDYTNTFNAYTIKSLNDKIVQLQNDKNEMLTLLNGVVSDKYFKYDQGTPLNIWTINHNLNKYPSVTIMDSAGTNVEGCITYTNNNTLSIEFSAGFSGTAILN